ncbi:MAG: Fic family protein [archaeon]
MNDFTYPTVEKIIEYNFLALEFIRVKKADQPKVLSHSKLSGVIADCEKKEGDLYDKAVVLLKGPIQKHPFASGNRRTAFISTKDFVISNKGKFGIKDDPTYARVMQGARKLLFR